jgi:hypothetical protein
MAYSRIARLARGTGNLPGSYEGRYARIHLPSPVLPVHSGLVLHRHHAVLDIDIGTEDLQQCADAVIRLRAEYLLATECDEAIAFDFTSGDRASWSNWRRGFRPKVVGNDVA